MQPECNKRGTRIDDIFFHAMYAKRAIDKQIPSLVSVPWLRDMDAPVKYMRLFENRTMVVVFNYKAETSLLSLDVDECCFSTDFMVYRTHEIIKVWIGVGCNP